MISAQKDENPVTPRDIEVDDLTTIKGIGAARERWLKESLNIYTFQDLAACSVDEIESELKAEGRAVPRNEINEWIAEAQELAATATPAAEQITEPEVVEAETTVNSAFVEGEWKPFASFVVEFQTLQVAGQAVEQRTKVHYMEGDKSKTWPDVERERLCQWMLDQVEEGLPQEIKEERATEQRPAVEIQPTAAQPVTRVEEPATVEEVEQVEPQVAAAEPATLTLSQLRVFQPPQTERPTATGKIGQPFMGYVRGNQSFALEAPFELAGPAAVEAANKEREYQVQFYACELSTGATTHLGKTQPGALIKGRLSYTAQLPKASLPPGIYRLRALAVVQATPPITAFLEVPLLQVA